jgi:predicted nucleotidyltransferase
MSPLVATAPPGNLAELALDDRLAHAGRAVQAVVQRAEATIEPRRVYLFGSRAAGRARALSDIDLAFESRRPDRWPAFATWVREEAPTLLDVDLVELTRCDPALRREILEHGVLLHEW